MAVADRVLAIAQAVSDIKAAIETRGVTVGTAPLADYAGLILQIDGPPEGSFLDGAVLINSSDMLAINGSGDVLLF